MSKGAYLAKTAGGFSPQDMNIQPASSPSQSFSSPQDMNIQPAVSVGFGQGQVDPGLAAAAGAGGITSTQQAQQQFTGPFTPNITQQTGGTSGFGQGTDTSGQGTDTSGSGDNEDDENLLDKFDNFMAFGKPIKKLNDNDLKLILEQVKLYQEGMPNYFQGIPGAANFVKGIFNSMGQGLERSGEFGGVEGSPTLEGLEDFIRRMDPDSNMLDSFKQADPTAYLDTFGLPQTDAGLDFFANLSLDDDTVDKLTQQKIIEARERLAQSKESQDSASGITSIPSSNFINTITTPNMDITKPGYTGDPNNPFGLPGDYNSGFMQSEFYKPGQPGLAVLTPVKMPDGTTHMFGNSASANQFQQYLDDLAMNKMGPSTGTPQTVGTSTGVPAAFNYANIAPQFTGSPYTNQGVSPAFLENLRRFYG